MWFRSLFDSFKSTSSRNAARRQNAKRRQRRAATRLRFEALEDRSLMTAYVLTDLGALDVVTDAYGTKLSVTHVSDINVAGHVVGDSYYYGGIQRAFLWTNGTMIDLGTLGGTYSLAEEINDLGQVVGMASNADESPVPFLLTPEDTNGDGSPDRWFRDLDGDGANDLMSSLGLPAGATRTAATGIHNAGQVVGVAQFSDSHSEAFLWDGAFTELGTLGGGHSSAYGINDAGQVAGYAVDALGRGRAFLWDSSHGMMDLGPGSAAAINTFGSVVGNSFAWTPDQPNGTTGTFTDLSTGDYSTVKDINDASQIVGSATYEYVYEEECDSWNPYYPNCGGGTYTVWEQRAILWENGVAADLSSLLVENPGVTLYEAAAINAQGQIVVAGSDYSGYAHAYLLTPSHGPIVSISDVSVVEGNSGTASAVFTVSLSAAYDQAVTVNYATADGTASSSSDYTAASGKLVFAAGETSKTITVLVKGDRLAEQNETFFVNLNGATNATIGDGQGLGTILDDEPRISISDVTKQEGRKNQTTLFTFTITLSAAYDQPVTMSFRTANGTATTGDSDYIAKTGTLTFAPGETTKTITIEVKGDSKKEASETFYLDLFANSSSSQFKKSRGIGTILNDD